MNREFRINLPKDENGYVGRKCPNPECNQYFKIKLGTGLPVTSCNCPYCGQKGDHQEFHTEEQIEYAKSVVIKELVEPELRKLEQSFKDLEQSTRGGLIQIKTHIDTQPFHLHHYQEREVETHIICDSCGLEFAIFGVFASCPDCGNLNALKVFEKSIEVSRKRLGLVKTIEESDKELVHAIFEDALSGSISSFDALGKALRRAYPNLLPSRPKNIFQNLMALSDAFTKSLGKSLQDIIGSENSEFLLKMFQVRHIYEHNMGIIDDDFVNKVSGYSRSKGRKYRLDINEIEKFLDTLLDAGRQIVSTLEQVI